MTEEHKQGYQVLESVEADFGELTWTFRLQPTNRVAAGNFVVSPVHQFMLMQAKLTQAEGLLRWVRDKGEPLTLNDRERIAKFFDPEPL